MILTAKAFLDENPHPSESEVKKAISGNLCRCTGYTKIVEAILSVSDIDQWSHTGKARGTHFTPQWGDIPAKGWRIHPRPKAVAFCCRGKTIPN
jgi:xanthine dehydrogenase iron-sulfur cluster and FAD-binding subunit A